MSSRHRNIPIFIPHLGCPNQCVFCNQRSISGCKEFYEERVQDLIEEELTRVRANPEDIDVAFFGGSFTGIDRSLMRRLLALASGYIDAGRVGGIRLSTRPDYISEEILDLLAHYGVRHIELGLQSMDDRVLAATRRGHTALDAEDACRAIVERGFSLTGQMMIGLPEATAESEMMTARSICALGAESARIYPTVVFHGTPLCEMTVRGEYTPLSVEEAVVRSASVCEIFEAADVSCIRIGLCATEELASPAQVYAGPNHPALGEMVLAEVYFRRTVRFLEAQKLLGTEIVLEVPEKEVSRAVGYRRENLRRLYEETGTRVVSVKGVPALTEMRAYRKNV